MPEHVLVKKTSKKNTISLQTSDVAAIIAGSIDRIVVVDIKSGRVISYKADLDMVKATMKRKGPSYYTATFR